MRKGHRIGLGAALLLAVAACGDRKGATGADVPVSTEDVAGAELARHQAEENARSRVTLVDAANGDAAGMPAEWPGPTAYDLHESQAEPGVKTDEREKPQALAAVRPEPAPDQEFPSVAE